VRPTQTALLLSLLVAFGALGRADPVGQLEDSKSCSGGYVIRAYRDQETGSGSFEILHRNLRLYERRGEWFSIGRVEPNDLFLVGPDFTACGKPHAVVFEYTGGNHCCTSAYVFLLGDEPRLLATIEGRHSTPVFRKTAFGQPWEIVMRDWSYAYWPSSFATSPAPEVILRWNGDAYVTAPNRMAKPAPSESELEAKARSIRRSPEWTFETNRYLRANIPSGLMQTALDLMYSGHEELGWKFIRQAWCPGFPLDETLLTDLRKRRSESPYWPAIENAQAIARSRIPPGSPTFSGRRSAGSRPNR
jgi:hypothetical protein